MYHHTAEVIHNRHEAASRGSPVLPAMANLLGFLRGDKDRQLEHHGDGDVVQDLLPLHSPWVEGEPQQREDEVVWTLRQLCHFLGILQGCAFLTVVFILCCQSLRGQKIVD